MAYLPDADTVDGYNASDLLKQIVQASAPAGDVNTRWINSDTGVEYRWNTGTSAWVVVGSAASAHAALTGLAGDDHTQYAPVQVINAGDTPSATYQRAGSIVVRRNAAAGTALGYVPLAGGTMTGALTLSGAPSAANHAATKAYSEARHVFTGRIARHFVTISTSWTSTDAGTLTLQAQSPGNTLLTLSGGNILIGSGVTSVLASFHVAALQTGAHAGDKSIHVRKNGVETAVTTYYTPVAGSSWLQATVPPFVLSVVAGDVLDGGVVSGGTGSIELLDAFLTVEVIGRT